MNHDYHITLKQLRYFLSVAETLNFTKAAKEHYIAQTAMSQNILALEKQLGVTLFERTKRKVTLTDAGRYLYDDFSRILLDIEISIERARRIQEGYNGSLRIGFQGIHENEILPKILRIFQKRYPQIDIILIQDSLYNLSIQLQNNKLDIIFSLSCEDVDDTEIDEFVFSREPLCAVLPTNHPLAKNKIVRRRQLAKEPVIFVKPENSSGTYEAMLHDCQKQGFTPHVVTCTENVESALMLVDAGLGVTFFPACCKGLNHHISFVELDENTFVELCIRWKRNSGNPAVSFLVEIVKKL